MQLVIEVPDDSPLVKQINSWKDGSGYELSVVQTSVGNFTLSDASEETQEEPGEDVEQPSYSEPEDSSNPAIQNLMSSKQV